MRVRRGGAEHVRAVYRPGAAGWMLAQEEARILNHNYIGTEHILLGLILWLDSATLKSI